MAKEKEIKSTVGFSLFFDKDLADAMRNMSNMSYKEVERNQHMFMNGDGRKMVEGMIRLVEAFAEPYHEMGWCEDPNCEYEKREPGADDAS